MLGGGGGGGGGPRASPLLYETLFGMGVSFGMAKVVWLIVIT